MNGKTFHILRRTIPRTGPERSYYASTALVSDDAGCRIRGSTQPSSTSCPHSHQRVQSSQQHPRPSIMKNQSRIHRVRLQRFSSQSNETSERDPIFTDEGVILHQADPSKSDGQGLVWGSVLWPSGVSLAKYLHYRYSSDQADGDGEKPLRVLELGCGTGIVGLTLAKCLPTSQVTLTDSESALWALLRKNIDCNIVPNTTSTNTSNQKRVVIHGLDWRDPTTFLPAHDFDLVVAADVLYAGMDKLFARALASHLLSDGKNEALVACPFRKDSPLEGFFRVCHRLGLEVDRLEDEEGRASGAHFGRDPFHAYDRSEFVPLDEESEQAKSREHVTVSPSFATGNEKNVQIFRIYRVKGGPEDAIQIRRVGRI